MMRTIDAEYNINHNSINVCNYRADEIDTGDFE